MFPQQCWRFHGQLLRLAVAYSSSCCQLLSRLSSADSYTETVRKEASVRVIVIMVVMMVMVNDNCYGNSKDNNYIDHNADGNIDISNTLLSLK